MSKTLQRILEGRLNMFIFWFDSWFVEASNYNRQQGHQFKNKPTKLNTKTNKSQKPQNWEFEETYLFHMTLREIVDSLP